MSKIKNRGLDQYGAESFTQQQFETAGIEGVNCTSSHKRPFSAILSIRTWCIY